MGTIDWVDQWAGNFNLETGAAYMVLWVVSFVGLICASVHLVSMLVTRWGDRGLAFKSISFSIIVHLSFVFGMVASAPLIEARPSVVVQDKADPVVQRIEIADEESTNHSQSGTTPVWDKLPEMPEPQISRLKRSAHFDEQQGPERRLDEPLNQSDTLVPELSELPDEPTPVPQSIDAADQGRRLASAAPIRIDDPEADTVAQLEPQPAPIEQKRVATGSLREKGLEERPSRGGVERIDRKFESTTQSASIGPTVEPTAIVKRGNNSSVIKHRSAPTLPSVLDDATGSNVKSPQPSRQGSTPIASMIRRPTRSLIDHELGGFQTLRPERNPQSGVAPMKRPIAFIRGLEAGSNVDALEPRIARPNFDPVRNRKSPQVPATYRLRNLERRLDIAKKYGGTAASELAVEASLRWLALHQNIDGSWDANGFSRHCPDGKLCRGMSGRKLHGLDRHKPENRRAGLHADTGLTALSVLCFLGAGYTHEEGRYADQVDRALSWLIRQQRGDGYLGGRATHYAAMYCHAMASYALAEAYGMQSDPTVDTRLREPIARAVAYNVQTQNPNDGGWRYLKGQPGDMSMFGWQLMALKSAEIANIPVPAQTKQLMIKFLKARSLGPRNGLATYRLTEPPSEPMPSMTAEALFCKQMLGIKRTNGATIEAVEYLLAHPPKRSTQNIYYWYYGTLAMYQYGGNSWRQWNELLRDQLVRDQRTTGHAAGSWDPKEPWGSSGGRIYSTALSTLCLEVYYRFLPLYQVGGQYTDD